MVLFSSQAKARAQFYPSTIPVHRVRARLRLLQYRASLGRHAHLDLLKAEQLRQVVGPAVGGITDPGATGSTLRRKLHSC